MRVRPNCTINAYFIDPYMSTIRGYIQSLFVKIVPITYCIHYDFFSQISGVRFFVNRFLGLRVGTLLGKVSG